MTTLVKHCEPLNALFTQAGVTLAHLRTDADVVAACDAVLKLTGLGATRHLVMMIRSAAALETPLSDRLALRAILDDDEDRAARIWRAALTGKPLDAADTPSSPPASP